MRGTAQIWLVAPGSTYMKWRGSRAVFRTRSHSSQSPRISFFLPLQSYAECAHAWSVTTHSLDRACAVRSRSRCDQVVDLGAVERERTAWSSCQYSSLARMSWQKARHRVVRWLCWLDAARITPLLRWTLPSGSLLWSYTLAGGKVICTICIKWVTKHLQAISKVLDEIVLAVEPAN